jgi:hypothetical protein
MNPVTQQLLDELDDPRLGEWIRAWDRLERLVIRVYKSGRAGPRDRVAFGRLRRVLRLGYPAHGALFARHWTGPDPYGAILDHRRAADFVGDWAAMQTLPAAREAINLGLLDLKAARGGPSPEPGLS